MPEVILRINFFPKCVKSLHQKKCRCIVLTHFEKKNSKCVKLVPNLTHFEKKNSNCVDLVPNLSTLKKKFQSA